jgi:Heparinase II/III-like protein/Heparinase II/III N-terminus
MIFMGTAVGHAALDRLCDLGLSSEIRGLELPEAQAVGPWRTRRPTRKAVLSNLFYVYGSEARLAPPIDWLQDPHGSRTWRYELHALTWLKEPLARHAASSDVEMLAIARDVVLDWAWAHLRSDGEQSEFAWYDMAVGLRAPYIGYVLRACLAEKMLSDEDAELLLEAAERHAAELAVVSNYAAGNNHGLFQDEGLYLLARQLPSLPAASAWRELALNRMRSTLRETVCFEEGAHLEHSTAYQFAILDLVARLAANVAELPELGPLLERMRRTAAWQTTPSGRMAQLGDTDDLPAPQWARQTAADLRGLRFLPRAGQAFVREGGSYLAVSAAYHGPAHKHADDGGFLLIENGRVVLGDAGRWGYYERDADRIYARSATAHNVLTVDGSDFDWRGAEPYGSGLDTSGEAEGWYAIALENPLLARQGVKHRRVLFYRPGKALTIFDRVRSDRRHEYLRHLHFGPDLDLELHGANKIEIAGEGVAATLTELSEGTEIRLSCGAEEPLLGWTYPGDRERTAISTAQLRTSGDNVDFVLAIGLDGGPVEPLPGSMRRYL